MLDSNRVVGARSLNMCIEKTTLFDGGWYRQFAIGDIAEAKRTIRLKVRGEFTSN